ncbi:carbohydrate-binding protein [Marinimicrobium agarilyticum]|uniref:carbohydrate-binding protein n=1 Tax=Marinimicrobium agarilyticum TaxID=306546 RepID=UPI000481B978|nr:carbohydrate-binding protein [Marinimicrobium agarilyticum]
MNKKQLATLPLMIATLSGGTLAGYHAVAQTLEVEAEAFDGSGGSYADGQPQPVSVYTVNGTDAINYVNHGDYVEYEIELADAGTYGVEYLVGTSVSSGSEVEFLVNDGSSWNSQGQTTVPTGHWDYFESVLAPHTVQLPAGTVRIRLHGSGSNAWQWNMDKFRLTLMESDVEPEPTPGLRQEAENYHAIGGTYADGQPDPISVYTVNGATALNYVNRGDYADYQVSVPQAGLYDLTYYIGTAISDGAAVELLVNESGSWVSKHTTSVPASSWDTFNALEATSSVYLPQGVVDIRLQGAGSNDWQWNLDAFELSFAGTASSSSSSASSSSSMPSSSASSSASSSVTSSVSSSASSSASSAPPSGDPIPVSGTFTLEAEHYQASAGELETYQVDGGTAVNYFNAGDHIEFVINHSDGGLYEAVYRVATGNSSGTAAGLMVTDHSGDLVLKNTTAITSQGDWDTFYDQTSSTRFNIFPGESRIRITGAGSEDFQFNIDAIEFRRIGAVDNNLDGDGDGISDINDVCPDTPDSEVANGEGCSASQRDGDEDGISDLIDQCPSTPQNAFVDEQGCESSGGDDDDFDGVANESDSCPTAYGVNVGPDGCSATGRDNDGDGVVNAEDTCSATPAGEFANRNGCSSSQVSNAETVTVNVNANIEHIVNGVSDFGRDRHMTMHSTVFEQDWNGHTDKLNYVLNTLDVYFGRDNGSATWKFGETPEDEQRPNHADLEWMVTRGEELRQLYENTPLYDRFPESKTEMIAGTNPHPTYPTLSWYSTGFTNTDWQPKDIQTSAEWMGQYLEQYFAHSGNGNVGEPMPTFWEVINEPDMKMKTGAFMVTNQEAIWEYHNLVANQIRSRLGSEAPMIGGMTWGQHDFYKRDGISRYADDNYDQWITHEDPQQEAEAEAFYENAMATPVDDTRAQDWYQWDVMWKGFMEAAGDNMDFYAVHIYDWPSVNMTGPETLRRGGHVQAMLDMMEWYDVHENGVNNRKPIVLSEYGAVQGGWDQRAHEERFDAESLKSFNAMLMQFLERPDYVIKSMPFTPAKPLWGYLPGGCGYDDATPCTTRYHYAMLIEDQLNSGNWEWSSYIHFYELWKDVQGTRVDTASTDPDVQVDSYVDGSNLFVILNNLETAATTVDLNVSGLGGNSLSNVELRQLYYPGDDSVLLDRRHMNQAPSTVTLEGNGTVVLRYSTNANIAVNEQVQEHKYFGDSVSGGSEPHRVSVAGGAVELNVDGVQVPSGAAEAMLRLTVALYPGEDDVEGGNLTLDSLTINGTAVETPIDWRGPKENSAERYFATLEIPVPVSVLQSNNQILADFHHNGELTVSNLTVWDFSTQPQR